MEWPITKQEWIRLRKEDERLRNIVSQHYQQLENYDDIMKEKDLLENLLLSTQQENERCEAELKIWKAYAKELEKKIESYEGPHWQVSNLCNFVDRPINSPNIKEHPGVPSTPVPVKVRKTGMFKQPVRSVRMMPMAREDKEDLSAINSEGSFTATPQFKSITQADLGKSLTHSDPNDGRMECLTNKAKRRSATFWEHEEQIVPALANAEKKQERRLSLQMLSEASVRRPVNDISVVLDEGDRHVDTDSAIGQSETATETLQVAGIISLRKALFSTRRVQYKTWTDQQID
ncbi:hypothetical protein QFC22_001374 [Naganishia vaughanmartiniae]|uniref:Uncharacterized protein n=1 Tax=Naganishia vaughanmartiniae TaxID=1424756 RepID=A0ACC2XIH6_9TREE|nr:hypothetical protein QFC22_001374 [Naganishia vaughanmartiniae]